MDKKKVSLFNLTSEKEKELDVQILDWKIDDAEKGGYPHFLLKEIIEQKKTIPKTAHINTSELEKIAKKIREGYKLVMVGCGTASYSTLAAKYFLSDLGIECEAVGAYEFLPFAKFYGHKSIFIAVSQSGETADTLIAARAAKKQGATIAAVLNARGSTLERLADFVLPVGVGPEIAVVSTKAFTAQTSTLYLLGHYVKGNPQKAISELDNVGKALENWLTVSLLGRIRDLARLLMDHEDMYLIGKYLNYPGCLEFALKIKESSYIHSEGFASGELKHGVITLIQKGTPCFVLAMNDEVKNEVLSSAAELKARGGEIIGVAPFGSHEFDISIKTPDIGKLTFFPNIIVGQLLGYYLGVGRGTDPDKPRNLAKSVTVK
jgi:glucosamine--fructose-6-phosphate aminotransferase (isomerizing)